MQHNHILMGRFTVKLNYCLTCVQLDYKKKTKQKVKDYHQLVRAAETFLTPPTNINSQQLNSEL